MLQKWSLAICVLAIFGATMPLLAQDKESEWIKMSDGKSFDGWKINENEKAWKIEDGAFVANGSRSHLFYVGADRPFKNFHFEAEVMTKKNSNGGIFFHTKFQDKDWPKQGYECQVNNSQGDPQRTGGLYNTQKVLEAPAKDDAYFKYEIIVEGQHVVVKIDGKTVVDYTQPEGKEQPALSEGTFALQAHDPGSTVYYKNLKVKRLP
jgi:hypothetical protein